MTPEFSLFPGDLVTPSATSYLKRLRGCVGMIVHIDPEMDWFTIRVMWIKDGRVHFDGHPESALTRVST